MRELKGRSILDFPESYVVIDVETTGLDPSKDHLIEIAALRVRDGKIEDSFSSLVKPSVEIDSFISDLTGITNEQLKTAPKPEDVLPQFCDFIGRDIVVGHNVNFDINFLYDNFIKYMGRPLSNDYMDTLRLSKRYCKQAPSYKLPLLANFLNIPVEESHRALSDCRTTNSLLQALKEVSNHPDPEESKLLSSLSFDNTNPFYCKRIAIKGLPQLYSYAFMKAVSDLCHTDFGNVFYKTCDYVIFSNHTYRRYKQGEYSEKFEKADELVKNGTLSILSEAEWCDMLHLPIPEQTSHSKKKTSSKDIITVKSDFDETHPLFDKLCVFTGTLEKMRREEAMQIVVNLGGYVGNSVTKKTNYLILGNNDYCPSVKDGKSSKQKKAESLKLSGQDIEIISENVFYDMISE